MKRMLPLLYALVFLDRYYYGKRVLKLGFMVSGWADRDKGPRRLVAVARDPLSKGVGKQATIVSLVGDTTRGYKGLVCGVVQPLLGPNRGPMEHMTHGENGESNDTGPGRKYYVVV